MITTVVIELYYRIGKKSTLLKGCSDSANESNLLSNLFREEVPFLIFGLNRTLRTDPFRLSLADGSVPVEGAKVIEAFNSQLVSKAATSRC